MAQENEIAHETTPYQPQMKLNEIYMSPAEDESFIENEAGTRYPTSLYSETGKSVGSQRDVTGWWNQYKIKPSRTRGFACVLVSGTRAHKGYQYPNGAGKIVHYSTLEAIRTIHGKVYNNTECYAKGWAHCSPPKAPNDRLPLTHFTSKFSLTEAYKLRIVLDHPNREGMKLAVTKPSAYTEDFEQRFFEFTKKGKDHWEIHEVNDIVPMDYDLPQEIYQ